MKSLALILVGFLIVDGDTIKKDGTRYRLWGLDCPEMDTRAGKIARRQLGMLIGKGPILCEQKDTDRYGRPVVRCEIPGAPPGSRDVARLMIRAGVCTEWCRYSRRYYGGETCER